MGLTLRGRSAKGCLRSLEGECWIDRESSGCEFRDARLGDRFRKLLTQIGSAMGQSIPLVCQDWANTKAAYRFFSNDGVTEADILAGHFQSTRDRAAAAGGLVLVLHDTTEFSYQREKSEAIGITKSINSGRDEGGSPQIAHGLRHPDAFEPRGHNRGDAAGVSGR
ncbi:MULTISPECIES: transposase DNA-binding-containing protein [unclassified Bradyrhizobium]|uniref:IS4/Tn5 family transposase DNA-binding protein n=1 Tax=unclassified Bradyrhizobium TaxID=2631580 RepID=UPI001FFAAB31|nr:MULTISPECIES: transposase DNA-binding-containing protein [unclassified Bradyrhizobium]